MNEESTINQDTVQSSTEKNGYEEEEYFSAFEHISGSESLQGALSDSTVSSEFTKVGFYCAVNARDCPQEEFDSIIKFHRDQVRALITEIEHLSDLNIQRINEKNELVDYDLASLASSLEEYELDTKDLIAKYLSLEEELESHKKNLYKLLEHLGEQKRDYFFEKLEQLNKVLERTLDIQDELMAKRNKIVSDFKKSNQSSLTIKKDWLVILKDNLIKRYSELHDTLQFLDARGINTFLLNTLTPLCFLGALVAGWFFSMYVNARETLPKTKDFGTVGVMDLMVDSATNSIHQIFRNPNPAMSAISGIASLLGLLILIFLLTWFCQWFIEKKYKNNPENSPELTIDLGNPDSLLSGSTIRSNNILHFWLQIMPILFVSGCFLVIASLQQSDELKNYVAAEAIGFLIPMALSVVCYFYINTKRQTSDSHTTKSYEPALSRGLIYLIAAFIVLNAGIFVLHLSRINLGPFLTVDVVRAIAIAEFSLISLITAFSYGTILYCRGIIDSSSYLNWKIDQVIQQIQNHERISAIDLTNDKFPQEYKSVTKLIFSFLKNKIDGLKSPSNVKPKKRTLFKLWKKLTLTQDKSPQLKEGIQQGDILYPELSDWEIQHFPEEVDKIKAEVLACINLEKRMAQIHADILNFKTRTSLRYSEIERRITFLRKQKDLNNQSILRERNVRLSRKKQEQYLGIVQENCIRDGFDLGMLHRTLTNAHDKAFYRPCTQPVPELLTTTNN